MLAGLVLKIWSSGSKARRSLRTQRFPPLPPGPPGSNVGFVTWQFLIGHGGSGTDALMNGPDHWRLEGEASARCLYKGVCGGPLVIAFIVVHFQSSLFAFLASTQRYAVFTLLLFCFLLVAPTVSPPPRQATIFGPYS
jgi:hypothetical protein